MEWVFQALGWTEVIHCIHRENAASVAVAERLGSRLLRTHQPNSGDAVEVYGQGRAKWLSRLSKASDV
jgi:RimJ/RimL family protein N-acetyltransferase